MDPNDQSNQNQNPPASPDGGQGGPAEGANEPVTPAPESGGAVTEEKCTHCGGSASSGNCTGCSQNQYACTCPPAGGSEPSQAPA